jgi:hypothetical protein
MILANYASIKKDLNWQISTPSVHRQISDDQRIPISYSMRHETKTTIHPLISSVTAAEVFRNKGLFKETP